MAKKFIGEIEKEFINKKSTSQKVKKEKLVERIQQTIYLQRSTHKMLWQHRIDTGEKISDFIDRIVREKIEGNHTSDQEKSSQKGSQGG